MIKRLLFATGTLLFSLPSISQSSLLLDINDAHVRFLSDGRLGYDPLTSSAGFEIPAGSGTHPLFAAAPWIGGIDPSGGLKMAGQRFGQVGADFWPGPLGTNGAITVATSAQWDKVWPITRAEVDAFITTGTITANISDWPAHGDLSLGQDYYLAPFVDTDGDGSYDPSQGDYPCFPGDQALYYIFNDQRVHAETGGAAIGAEFRVMAYAYATSDPALDQTIFVHYHIKNQSSETLLETYVGMFADYDLGNSSDDHIGSDVGRGLMYVYNGDAFDEAGFSSPGYGAQPPAFGTVVLQGPKQDATGIDDPSSNALPAYNGVHYGNGTADDERLGLSRVSYFTNGSSQTGEPSVASHYYSALQGFWNDGNPHLYGGNAHPSSPGANPNQPTAFVFPGSSDPYGAATGGNVQTPWSEISAQSIPSDRRALGSMGPFTMAAGEEIGIDVAFIYARASAGGPLGSVAALQTRTDSIRDFFVSNELYLTQLNGSCGAVLPPNGVEEFGQNDLQIELFPIPAEEELNVLAASNTGRLPFTVHDLTGKIVLSGVVQGASTQLSVASLETGVYLLNLTTASGSKVLRFVKN